MNKVRYIAAVLIAITGFGLQRADAIQYTLSSGNPALTNAGFTGTYATVSVYLVNSTTATVPFNSHTQTIVRNSYVYLLGDAPTIAFYLPVKTLRIGGHSASHQLFLY